MSEAAHWLKTSSSTTKKINSNDSKRMKAAKVNKAEYVYPEYLMMCKLVRKVDTANSGN